MGINTPDSFRQVGNEGKTTQTLLHILETCHSKQSERVLFWCLHRAHIDYCMNLFVHLAEKLYPDSPISHKDTNTLVVNNNSVTFSSALSCRGLNDLKHHSIAYSYFLIDHSVYEQFMWTPNL